MVALGVNIDSNPTSAPSDCALVAKLGGRWVRVSIEESNPNAIGDLRAIVAAAHAHGLLVVQTCQPLGHVQPRTQARQDAYALFVAQCAAIADATGRDNESNGFGSNETPDPSACADSMVACIAARDQHAKGRILITDELCPASGPIGSTYVEPLTFFKAMAARQPSILHAPHVWLGWHGYCDFRHLAIASPYTWDTCWQARALDTFVVSVTGEHPVIASTEFGACTAPPGFDQTVTPQEQAADFNGYLAECHAQRKVGVRHGPWIWYRLRDTIPANSSDWPAGCGLVDVHGASKPIAALFTQHAKAAA